MPSAKNIGPVDVVYTWVNGDDPDYLDIYNQHAEKPKDANPERVRDVYQTLKYSLRSVEKFASWIRTIYIVTARPQVPEWLNRNHPKVKVVHHDEIIDEAYLPTFNYNTIESCIHKCPSISEYFIYMNDDFLFGNEVHLSDFIDENGRLTVFGTLFGENLKFRIYERKNDVISLGLVEHNPIFYKKSFVEELQELHKEKFHETRNSKFRRNDNVTMQKVFKQYMLSNRKEVSNPIRVTDLKKIHTFHKVKNNLATQEKAIAKLKKKKPKFYCLNDDQRDSPNPDVVSFIKKFLEESYPKKAIFEKN
ncbi:MAG: Stealth CR1 domain-containing protein [Cyclobacteriaceae bacterium]